MRKIIILVSIIVLASFAYAGIIDDKTVIRNESTVLQDDDPRLFLRDTDDDTAVRVMYDSSEFTIDRGTLTSYTDEDDWTLVDNLLTFDTTGSASFSSTIVADGICDSDKDTCVYVEESADEDVVRIDAGGYERITIETQAGGAGDIEISDSRTGNMGNQMNSLELDVDHTIQPSAQSRGLLIDHDVTSTSTGLVVGIDVDLDVASSSASPTYISGSRISTDVTGTGAEVYAFDGAASISGTDTHDVLSGFRYNTVSSSSGAIAAMYGAQFNTQLLAGANVTTMYGLSSVITLAGTSSVNTYYGLYLAKANTGTPTNYWGIYQADPAAINYFAGEVQMPGNREAATAGGLNILSVNPELDGSFTQDNQSSILVEDTTESGGAAVTSLIGIELNEQTAATNNTNLHIGDTQDTSQDWNIYSESTRDSYFKGGTVTFGGTMVVDGTMDTTGKVTFYNSVIIYDALEIDTSNVSALKVWDSEVATVLDVDTINKKVMINSELTFYRSGGDGWIDENTGNLHLEAAGNVIETDDLLYLDSDVTKIFFGEDQDAGIYYDGTDLRIDTQEVGSGNLWIEKDSVELEFGGEQDASIMYDGTDMLISPWDSGNGTVRIKNDTEASRTNLTLQHDIAPTNFENNTYNALTIDADIAANASIFAQGTFNLINVDLDGGNVGAGAFTPTYRVFNIDADFTEAAGVLTVLPTILRVDLDADANTAMSGNIFDVNVTAMNNVLNFTNGAISYVFDTASVIGINAFFSKISGASSGQTTAFRAENVPKAGFSGEATGGFFIVSGVGGTASLATGVDSSVGSAGVPTVDKRMAYRGNSGHWLANQGSLFVRSTSTTSPNSFASTHLTHTSLDGDGYFEGDLEVDGTIWSDGDTVVGGDLDTTGVATFNTTVSVEGDLRSVACPIKTSTFWAEEGSSMNTGTSGGLQYSFGNGNVAANGITQPCDGVVVMMALSCENDTAASTGVLQIAKNGVAQGSGCEVATPNLGDDGAYDDTCAITFVQDDELTVITTTSDSTANGCTGTFWVQYD